MQLATCPSCGTKVELDFRPATGVVWCPQCQELFPCQPRSNPSHESLN
jgi:hypothetical protein